MNLSVDITASTNVNLNSLTQTYIINAIAGNTYNYNLPLVTCDGQMFDLIRQDGTTAIVNLIGSMQLNGGNITNYVIAPYTSVTVVSVNSGSGGTWYIVNSSFNSTTVVKNVFSAFFIGNSGIPYITVTSGSTFLSFPFLGTSTGLTINTIVATFGNPISVSGSTLTLFRSNGTLITTISLTLASTNVIFNPSVASQNLLPSAIDYLYVTYTGSSSFAISSIIFYT